MCGGTSTLRIQSVDLPKTGRLLGGQESVKVAMKPPSSTADGANSWVKPKQTLAAHQTSAARKDAEDLFSLKPVRARNTQADAENVLYAQCPRRWQFGSGGRPPSGRRHCLRMKSSRTVPMPRIQTQLNRHPELHRTIEVLDCSFTLGPWV